MKKIILLMLFLFSSSLLAQRTVSMNFDLYQNAANNIIAMEGSFPLYWFSGKWNFGLIKQGRSADISNLDSF
jgi:hypothetical protein